MVDGYRDGAIRLFGYKKGKNVTFLGKRGPDRILNIEYVFGDNCNNYFLYMHNLGIFDMKVSIIFTTITIALGFIISIRI